jgi:nicotinate (nicotinamide) nucleotide adenylyltransferase
MDKAKKNVDELTGISAFFGGTFDPPHYGHLRPLQETANILQLPMISLLPANVPVFKSDISEAKHRIAMTKLLCALDKRLTVDLSEFERADVSYTIETLKHIKEQQPHQRIIFIIGLDSLLSLHRWERWQQLFDYAHIVVMQRPILSSLDAAQHADMKNQSGTVENTVEYKMASKLYNLYTTEQNFDVITGANMAADVRSFLISRLARPENDSQCINHSTFKDIIRNSASGKLWFIDNQTLPMSSSYIRDSLQAGKDISNWVPKSIQHYIKQHKLYRN